MYYHIFLYMVACNPMQPLYRASLNAPWQLFWHLKIQLSWDVVSRDHGSQGYQHYQAKHTLLRRRTTISIVGSNHSIKNRMCPLRPLFYF